MESMEDQTTTTTTSFTQQLLRGKLISTKTIFVCSVCQFETGNEPVLHIHMSEDHLNFINWNNPKNKDNALESSVKESEANNLSQPGNVIIMAIQKIHDTLRGRGRVATVSPNIEWGRR